MHVRIWQATHIGKKGQALLLRKSSRQESWVSGWLV